jgi:hypothetical protein
MARCTLQIGDSDLDVVAVGGLATVLATIGEGKAIHVVGTLRVNKHTTELDIETITPL